LYSQQLADKGLDPLPNWTPDVESREANPKRAARYPLQMVSAAAHHFLNSSFGNVPSLRRAHGEPFVELHPADADPREIREGDWVEIANDRGSFLARARIGETVPPGTVFTPTLWWPQFAPDGKGANHTTSDALSDYAGGATFHGNLVELSLAMAPELRQDILTEPAEQPESALVGAR
jgi:anaerobic selenocysteine-containing dehydrogenase